MSGRVRAFASARRWAFAAVLLALVLSVTFAVWVRGKRSGVLSAWQAAAESRGMRLRIGGSEGLLGPRILRNVELEVSPEVRVGVASVDLGVWPWERSFRAHGIALRLRGPLDAVWGQLRGLSWPSDFQVADVRVEYAHATVGTLLAEGVSSRSSAEGDHVHVGALHTLGTTFRNLDLWARPQSAELQLQLRLASDSADAKAPKLGLNRRPGQGVEWTLDIPSQPFSEWARRTGLKTDETWEKATVVGMGSLIVPESRALPARADLRFTIDDWHQPSWPEAKSLTGRSGAIALRVEPGAGATHRISRVEVAAGLFSLLGSGQLSFGAPSRLTFEARGQLTCAQLLEHLPDSRYRERVRAHLREHAEDSTNGASVRLELAVRAEAPDGAPLQFRWHLHAGCGLPELTED